MEKIGRFFVQNRHGLKMSRGVHCNFVLVHLGVIHLVRTQNFPETNIFYPLIGTRTCAYQMVRNVSFRKILRTDYMDNHLRNKTNYNLFAYSRRYFKSETFFSSCHGEMRGTFVEKEQSLGCA